MDDDATTGASDDAVARAVAEAAGALLLDVRRSGGPDPGGAGDRRSHRFIVDELARLRPEDPVRSEEGAGEDGPRRAAGGSGRLWIVDPLDGTREFSEGLGEFAVHVALSVDGRPTAGAVALPALDLVLATDRPPVLPPAQPGRLRIAVSRSRPPALARAVADRLGATLVPMGSAGYKIAAVLRGEVDIYLHGGGQYEWDSAAPVAVALAAGAHASRLDGSPLRYGQPDAWLPDLLVCRRELADQVLAAVRAATPETTT